MTNNPKPAPYPWDEFRFKWEHDELTTAQAVGQLIVWGEQHDERLLALMRELEGLAHSLTDHDARHGIERRS